MLNSTMATKNKK